LARRGIVFFGGFQLPPQVQPTYIWYRYAQGAQTENPYEIPSRPRAGEELILMGARPTGFPDLRLVGLTLTASRHGR